METPPIIADSLCGDVTRRFAGKEAGALSGPTVWPSCREIVRQPDQRSEVGEPQAEQEDLGAEFHPVVPDYRPCPLCCTPVGSPDG